MSLTARAESLEWLHEYTYWVEVDYRRFDQTVSEAILAAFETRVLTHPYGRQEQPLFHAALTLALKTKGVSDFGVMYSRVGGRCSGDAHTSIGNGLINYFLTWVCLRHRNNWRSVHEGDDGIIAFRGHSPQDIMDDLSYLKILGFEAKLRCTNVLSEVIFCGRRIISTSEGTRDMADVTRTLKKFHATMSQGDAKHLLLAKAISYNHTDGDTPLIGALSHAIVKVLGPQVDVQGRRMKRAMAAILRTRWALGDVPQGTSRWLTTRMPQVHPEAYAAVCQYEHMSYAAVRALEREYLSWIDLGFIPEQVTQLLIDPTIEPAGVAVHGVHKYSI